MLVFWTFVLRCSSDKILSYEADNNLIMFYFIKVGGSEGSTSLSSAERFDPTTKEWHPIASMSTKRAYLGVGVLNDLLYAVNSEEEIPIWEKDKYLILSFFWSEDSNTLLMFSHRWNVTPRKLKNGHPSAKWYRILFCTCVKFLIFYRFCVH